jgi:plastocyanin domain-containing protein
MLKMMLVTVQLSGNMFFMEVTMRSFRCAGTVLAIFFMLRMSAAAAEKKEFTAKTDPDGVQRVEILGGSYFFDPNYVIVKVNVPVELKFRKESGMIPHDVVLKAPEAGIDFKVELKETPEIVKFTPTKTGTFTFDCSKKLLFFESHKEKGMTGTLEVRD